MVSRKLALVEVAGSYARIKSESKYISHGSSKEALETSQTSASCQKI